jgi:hypothetical protein
VEVWLTISSLFQDLHQYKDALGAIATARGLDGYNADVECAHGLWHEVQGWLMNSFSAGRRRFLLRTRW